MPALVDKDKCVSCGACVGTCPVTAIEMDGNQKAQVDPETCIDCSACVGVCPAEAISME